MITHPCVFITNFNLVSNRLKVQGGYKAPSLGPRRFCSGGNDNCVRIWRWDDDNNEWMQEARLVGEGKKNNFNTGHTQHYHAPILMTGYDF